MFDSCTSRKDVVRISSLSRSLERTIRTGAIWCWKPGVIWWDDVVWCYKRPIEIFFRQSQGSMRAINLHFYCLKEISYISRFHKGAHFYEWVDLSCLELTAHLQTFTTIQYARGHLMYFVNHIAFSCKICRYWGSIKHIIYLNQ